MDESGEILMSDKKGSLYKRLIDKNICPFCGSQLPDKESLEAHMKDIE